MYHRRALLIAGTFLALALALSACVVPTEINEVISSELRVFDVRGLADTVTEQKRFRFDSDPSDAEFIELRSVTIIITDIDGSDDLTFIDTLTVMVIDDEGEFELARGTDFKTGETVASLDVTYTDDLRERLNDEERLVLRFVLVPADGYGEYPIEGIPMVIRANVRIDTQ